MILSLPTTLSLSLSISPHSATFDFPRGRGFPLVFNPELAQQKERKEGREEGRPSTSIRSLARSTAILDLSTEDIYGDAAAAAAVANYKGNRARGRGAGIPLHGSERVIASREKFVLCPCLLEKQSLS